MGDWTRTSTDGGLNSMSLPIGLRPQDITLIRMLCGHYTQYTDSL